MNAALIIKCVWFFLLLDVGEPISDQHDEVNKLTTSFNMSSMASPPRSIRIGEVDMNSATGKTIRTYFDNSNAHHLNMRITKIFSVKRKYEQELFAQWADEGEDNRHLLLWHGTRLEKLQAILEDGLQLPSLSYVDDWIYKQSAFVTTMVSMFGPAIFFADRSSKSAKYTDQDGMGVLLLCQLALGHTMKASDARDFSKGPSGYDSVMGLGKMIPDANGTLQLEGVYLPAGTTVRHPAKPYDPFHAHPYHNEYIVFDPSRIVIRYIVQIESKQ